ncbi:copper resistance protein NlpE N-terminal domain-containing protein [Alcanivorax sp. S6407]|uniref:copper resistance protein NlpE n=1 Tax=Alcanivorax sp. S6407 TaxID=2926424 RepID=UPI001FF4B78E|nr:copper resistance protein NlpE [Alcanivorax sp. S6407]MCK0153278.1 copper resistance protein NlpE N-terminal domain-containing protein [Alcanivorax sp. S6407]
MKKITIAGLTSMTLLAGCQTPPPEPEPVVINPTAQKVVYSGMLPCADCSGIRTTLTLYRDQFDAPTRFQLREEYLQGSKVGLTAVERGDWSQESRIQDDRQMELYIINPETPDAVRQYLRDAVNAVEQLDENGAVIESSMNYRLLRK